VDNLPGEIPPDLSPGSPRSRFSASSMPLKSVLAHTRKPRSSAVLRSSIGPGISRVLRRSLSPVYVHQADAWSTSRFVTGFCHPMLDSGRKLAMEGLPGSE